ncbi:MAG: TauD/TfdA family dioxygenase [Alphaproteobacteria bacterium]|nr:TauD/TfdA family dioxygenase [Alphaproteobacteria bacterium]
MPIVINPITETFAAEVGGLDLRRPLEPGELQVIEDAFKRFSVLVFVEQELSDQQQVDFSLNFGPLETAMGNIRTDTKQRLRPDLADVSNLDENNELLKPDDRRRMFNLGNQLWHTDSSFKRTPAKASLLYAKAVPPIGGCTEFADLRAAYDALPEEMKRRIEGLVAEHSIFTSRAKTGYANFSQEEREQLPPVPQVVVRTHPGSKRKTLYLASHAGHILGMDAEAGRQLLADLIAHATQRQFVYTHRWRVGDLVMWDDRCTMHRGRPFDDLKYRRSVQRSTVADVAPTVEQEGIRLVA